ncbi:hypothetical protein [Bacillus paralicheniformis]|uniref:hypothetical protein n=1 Tax=Bacillus paralicheniformis TaxID=1648923 RepID=UPI0022829A01|nr:hypothetical protein [Bacillus paralicheniformis]MCY8151334.1 hypothetical protein [Bacillus paralicheniformis]MEC1053184.1 hypothetical protein [Bacillus paralicheniformis]MEC1087746.1 hypothetical protein [Bacillus paralicheniformis]MEC1108815.1 hypothetical protein [Bacillus paralicheniformis]MEC1141084.1 hypothetical protein [Bacillus paralicheniformis]
MQSKDSFSNMANLNDQGFNKIIKELRSRGTEGANELADALVATRIIENQDKKSN